MIKVGVLDQSYTVECIVLFCSTFVLFGMALLQSDSDTYSIGRIIFSVSLMLVGISFSIMIISIEMYNVSQNSPLIIASGIIFMISVIGAIVGGIAGE